MVICCSRPGAASTFTAAGGRDVLAAGEITFTQDEQAWRAVAVTNHSTGYCPAPESWPAAAAALDRAGIARPPGYDPVVVFRRCPACQARNIVRDEHFACAICDGPCRGNGTSGPRRPDQARPPPGTGVGSSVLSCACSRRSGVRCGPISAVPA